MGGSTSLCTNRLLRLSALLLALGVSSAAIAAPEILPSHPIPAPQGASGTPKYTTTMRNAKGVAVVVGEGFNASQLFGKAPVGSGGGLADLAPPARHYVRDTPQRRLPANMEQLAGHLLPSPTAASRSTPHGLAEFKTNAPMTAQQRDLERKLTAKFLPYQQLTPQDILKPTFRKPDSR